MEVITKRCRNICSVEQNTERVNVLETTTLSNGETTTKTLIFDRDTVSPGAIMRHRTEKNTINENQYFGK